MCSCSLSKRKRRGVGRNVTFSRKSIEANVPYLVGGGAAIAVNPFVNNFLSSQSSTIRGVFKTGVGFLALSMASKYADGFGVVMGAEGIATLLDEALKLLGQQPIFNIARRPGLAGVNVGVLGGSTVPFGNPVAAASGNFANAGGLRR